MKAIVLGEYGGPDALRLTDLPDPKVAPGEVLVRVKAAGVNPVDWKLAEGNLDGLMETHFPLIRRSGRGVRSEAQAGVHRRMTRSRAGVPAPRAARSGA